MSNNTRQALEIVAKVATQVCWDEIDERNLQEVIDLTPEEFSKSLTAFLNNGCRITKSDSKSLLTKPFNLAEFLGKNWTTWKGPIDGNGLSGEEDIDPRSMELSKVELTKFLFETCLKAGERYITGEEKLRRQKEEHPNFIRFDGNVFLSLWLDYQANRENSVLERLHRNFGVTFMDFMGQILRSPDGRRGVLCLDRGGDGGWRWSYGWLGHQWHAGYPSVGCASRSLVIKP